MRILVALVAVVVIVASSGEAMEVPPGTRLYRSEGCGVAFLIPASWIAAEGKQANSGWLEHEKVAQCSVGLKPRDWEAIRKASKFEMPQYAVTISVVKRGFRELAHSAGFSQVKRLRRFLGADVFPELNDDDWLMAIRQGETPAEWIVTKCCRGIRATGWSRDWAKDGSIGSVHPRRALLNNYRGTSALIESDSHHAVVDLVTGTFAVIDSGPN